MKPNDRLWLRLKSQIHRLEPLRRIEEPKNIIRRLLFKIISSPYYFYFKIILFLAYLVFCSCYTYNPSYKHFRFGQNIFIFLLIVDYFLEIFSFGFRKDRVKKFVFETFCMIYFLGFFIARQVLDLNRDSESIFGGLLMALQFFRFLQCNYPIILVID